LRYRLAETGMPSSKAAQIEDHGVAIE